MTGRGYLFDTEVTTVDPVADSAKPAAVETSRAPHLFGLRRPVALAGIAALGAIIVLAFAVPIFGSGLFTKTPTTIAVMPITIAGDDPEAAAMAAGVAARLTDGLAKIDNIRVVTPPKDIAAPAQAAFLVSGELQKGDQAWTLQARMIRSADRSVQPVTSITVGGKSPMPRSSNRGSPPASVISSRCASTT